MLKIMVATVRSESLATFLEALSIPGEVDLRLVPSGMETLAAATASPPHLVVVDSELPDIAALGLVQKLLMANAMVNTAVISPLTEEDFHEQSEGLGVLGRLPEKPDFHDAQALLQKLRTILGLKG